MLMSDAFGAAKLRLAREIESNPALPCKPIQADPWVISSLLQKAIRLAGAFRRSEIAAIQCDSIMGTEQGISITLRRSKTGQENRGRSVVIPKVRGPICPVAALERWMQVSGIKEGTLFRPLTKSGKVRIEGLSASAVAVIVKQRAMQIGLERTYFSGHSLRAGFATSAAVAGLPVWRIEHQTGHVSDAVLGRYIREADVDLPSS